MPRYVVDLAEPTRLVVNGQTKVGKLARIKPSIEEVVIKDCTLSVGHLASYADRAYEVGVALCSNKFSSAHDLSERNDETSIRTSSRGRPQGGVSRRTSSRSFRSLWLPSHVTTLRLESVRVEAPLWLAEGLQKLYLKQVSSAVSLSRWTFPASLKKVKIIDHQDDSLDLRSVTAPFLSLQSPKHLREGTAVRLPEVLDKLTLDGRGAIISRTLAFGPFDGDDLSVIDLPPYLGLLKLSFIDKVYSLVSERTASIKHVKLVACDTSIDLAELFPGVETLEIEYMSGPRFPSIAFPKLRTLTLIECMPTSRIYLDAPVLETLTAINDTGREGGIELGTEGNLLGESLVTLSLEGSSSFPEVKEWKRLESLTVAKSWVQLPFMRRLTHLSLDEPTSTKKTKVANLAEYKRAWAIALPRLPPLPRSHSPS